MAENKEKRLSERLLLGIIAGGISILVTLMSWFLIDFGVWKADISSGLNSFGKKVDDHIIESAKKQAEQDIIIYLNRAGVNANKEDIKEIKVGLKKSGIF